MRRRDEVAVGVLLTVAVIILLTGTLWLARGGLSRGYPLYVRFPWGQNLKQGQGVLLAGVTVGYVADVNINPNGLLDVDLFVRKQYRIPRTAVAEVSAVGLFGDVVVALKVSRPDTISFQPGDTLPVRTEAAGLDALQARADTIARSLERMTKVLETELFATGAIRDLRDAITGTKRFVDQLQTTVAEQNTNVTATLASVRGSVDSAKIAQTAADVRTMAANADSLMQRLSSNSTQLQAILARLERGEGTAGKLLADTMLYRDSRVLMARIDSLLVDFKKNPKKYFTIEIF